MKLAALLATFALVGISIAASACGDDDDSGPAREITQDELAAHNTAADCWVEVDGDVYDLTSLIPDHSGSPDVLIPLCGTDATEAWRTKGGRGADHSARAENTLSGLRVGVLAED